MDVKTIVCVQARARLRMTEEEMELAKGGRDEGKLFP